MFMIDLSSVAYNFEQCFLTLQRERHFVTVSCIIICCFITEIRKEYEIMRTVLQWKQDRNRCFFSLKHGENQLSGSIRDCIRHYSRVSLIHSIQQNGWKLPTESNFVRIGEMIQKFLNSVFFQDEGRRQVSIAQHVTAASFCSNRLNGSTVLRLFPFIKWCLSPFCIS